MTEIVLIAATIDHLTALQRHPAGSVELGFGPAPEGWPEFPEAVDFHLGWAVTLLNFCRLLVWVNRSKSPSSRHRVHHRQCVRLGGGQVAAQQPVPKVLVTVRSRD